MAILKRIEKIVQENPFDEKKKRPGLKFNPGLVLIGLRTTGPYSMYDSTAQISRLQTQKKAKFAELSELRFN